MTLAAGRLGVDTAGMNSRDLPKLCLHACLLLALALPLQARMEHATTMGGDRFLDPEKIVVDNLVPGYPKADSQAQAEDMAVLLWLQHTRSPADMAKAQQLSNLGLDAFRDIIGDSLAEFNEDALKAMFGDVTNSLSQIIYPAKDAYNRRRPYAVNLQLEPCVELEESRSYPSGHSMAGMVFAMLLADLMPEHREALMQRGHDIGYYRAVGGVHYPTDILAGQRLGTACAEQILGGSAWQSWKQYTAKRK